MIKFKAEQLPDCKSNLWYVTECEIKGVIGICAKTFDELEAIVPLACAEMIELNGLPDTEGLEKSDD